MGDMAFEETLTTEDHTTNIEATTTYYRDPKTGERLTEAQVQAKYGLSLQ